MQIKQSEHITTTYRFRLFLKQKRKAILWVCLFILLIVVFICGTAISKKAKANGYDGLTDFVSTVFSNYWNSRNSNPENISIEIKDKDLKKLEKNRKQALERGVIINDLDGDYVPATIEYKGHKMNVKLRLKGHMTDHLQDNKWSFRIKVKDKDSFMGMRRFSIQHPGTRGYIYEWIYHQLMKREDIIALRYQFINVNVNGKDWGIYAVEENFDKELIENNNRKKSPIIRFNPDLYWVDRYNEMNHVKPVAEFASFYSANPEAYREEDVLKDSLQLQYYLKALTLIEGFRTRKISAAQTFDIPRMAKFNALIDLVGGQHSIDWSDIKYYYNPVTAKLEPVAYESFTTFPFESIAGNYKYTILDSTKVFKDLHTALFSDSTFFKAYIRELQRVSNTVYLDSFFKEIDSSLQLNLGILYKEFPYKKFDKENYYANQEMIRKIMHAPKSIHAYLKSDSYESVCVQLGAIESLPIEIKSLKKNNALYYPVKPIILPAKQANRYVQYNDYCFQLQKLSGSMKSDPHGLPGQNGSLSINYSLLGSDEVKQELVFPFPYMDLQYIEDVLNNNKSTIEYFPFLKKNESQKLITIQPGHHKIDKDLIIPAGYKVLATNTSSIDLINNSKIISHSPLFFSGTEDELFILSSSDFTGQGIELINAPGSVFRNVLFKNIPEVHDQQWKRSGYITCYESTIRMEHCHFINSKAKNVVNLIRSGYTISACLFQEATGDALNIDFSEGIVVNSAFENCRTGIKANMSQVDLKGIQFINVNMQVDHNKSSTITMNGKVIQ